MARKNLYIINFARRGIVGMPRSAVAEASKTVCCILKSSRLGEFRKNMQAFYCLECKKLEEKPTEKKTLQI
jgi:hypothetical protein